MIIDCACNAKPRQILLDDHTMKEAQQQPWVEYECPYCRYEILVEEERGVYFSYHSP